MTAYRVEATPRAAKGRAVRRDGFVPAIVYGRGQEPQPIQLRQTDVKRLVERQGLIELSLDGKKQNVMVKDVQRDPVLGRVLHLDFQRVALDEKVQTTVPFRTTGDEKVKGVVQVLVQALEIACLPNEVPDAVVADVSGLEPGTVLRVKDLEIPSGVDVLTDPETVVVAVDALKTQAPAAETAEEPGAVEAGAGAGEADGSEEA